MRPEFHILLIEDSPTDAQILERALREGGVGHRLSVLREGSQALALLIAMSGPGGASADLPDLILLDLNLPGLDGFQVLARIKEAPRLRSIPVVVLTTSRHEADVSRAYDAGANTYIQKPGEFPLYRELVQTLRHYWYATALLPPRRGPGP